MRASFRTVVITGASSGLGAALARAYAAPQVALGLTGRDRVRLAATARACEAGGATVTTAAIDVVDRAAMESWLLGFDRDHPVELLVANAGIAAGTDPANPSEGVDIAAAQIAVNLLGAINTVEPLVPAMCARGRGRIIVVASLAALRGLPYSPGYCASKAGLRAYAEALRPRLAPYGVGIAVACPGFFASAMSDRWDGPKPLLMSGERAAAHIRRSIERGRRRIVFPWLLALGMRFCDLAPAVLGDAILRRFRFRIRSA
jgi:short-subunit dehydrogenase